MKYQETCLHRLAGWRLAGASWQLAGGNLLIAWTAWEQILNSTFPSSRKVLY